MSVVNVGVPLGAFFKVVSRSNLLALFLLPLFSDGNPKQALLFCCKFGWDGVRV